MRLEWSRTFVCSLFVIALVHAAAATDNVISLPQARPGDTYSAQLSIPPGLGYPFALCRMTGLPSGLKFDPTTFLISGRAPLKPQQVENIVLKIQDRQQHSQTYTFSLSITSAPFSVDLGATPAPPSSPAAAVAEPDPTPAQPQPRLSKTALALAPAPRVQATADRAQARTRPDPRPETAAPPEVEQPPAPGHAGTGPESNPDPDPLGQAPMPADQAASSNSQAGTSQAATPPARNAAELNTDVGNAGDKAEDSGLWGDEDERPLDIKFVGGYEEGFQSSQASTSDAFLAIYGRRLFWKDRVGSYFAARLQTAPQASGTYNVFSVLENPSGKISTKDLNSVGSAVDLSIGVEYQFAHPDNWRTSLSVIAGTGMITPVQSNSISATFKMPDFGTIECTELQGRLAPVLSGANYKGIVANTGAGSKSCFSNTLNANSGSNPPVAPVAVGLLEYATPDTPNFFPKCSVGLRIVNRYRQTATAPQKCVEGTSPCERGYVDFTIGQSAALTGGALRHAVFTIDTIHPLPIPNVNYVYLFGSVSKRFHNLPPSLAPLVLQTGTASLGPSAGTLIIPLTQPDRDFYRIGAGVDITKIFAALTANAKGSNKPTNQSK